MVFTELSLYLIFALLILVKTKRQEVVLFWFVCLICLIFLSVSIHVVFNNLDFAGQDFYAYYHATHYFNIGLNPYLETGILQYRYFPVTFYFFNFFTLWDYSESLRIYMLLKTFIYLFTILIWAVYLFKDYKMKTFFILIATFGYKTAALIDFNSGNITVFEFFALTLAFIYLFRNNVIIYCFIIVILALFKVQILLLILIPLVKFDRKNIFVVLFFLMASAAIFFSYYYFEPALMQAYINQINNALGEKGLYSPNFGILQLISTFAVPFIKPVMDFKYLNYLIYFSWLILLALITFLIIKKTKSKVPDTILISYLILVYALSVPRFQDYTFVLLIVPSVFVIHYCVPGKILKSVVCLIICTGYLGYYLPFYALIILFLFSLIFFYRVSAGKISFGGQQPDLIKTKKWTTEVVSKEQLNTQKLILISASSIFVIALIAVYIALPKTDNFLYNLLLSKNEIKISNYLKNLRIDFIKNAGEKFSMSENFLNYRSMIDTSEIFHIFKKMPKGGNLNLNLSAGINSGWIVENLTYMDNCYMYTSIDSAEIYGSLMFFNADSVPAGWKSLKELRQTGQISDDSIKNMITIDEAKSDNSGIQSRFENIIRHLGLINYEQAFRKYIRSLFETLITDGLQYVELRANLSQVYDLKGKIFTPEEVILIYKEIIDNVKISHPEFNAKIIYSVYRDSSNETDKDELYKAYELRKKYPDILIGFEYAFNSDEINDISFHPEQFYRLDSIAGKENIEPAYFFDLRKSEPQNNEIIRSALLLNPKRIANVYNLSDFPDLESEVKEKQITIEVCPLSDQLLGYIPDLTLHPAQGYINGNIPVAITSDYPQIFNYDGMTYDFLAAYLAWELDFSAIKKLAINSLNNSGMNDKEKKEALKLFNLKWDEFINDLARTIN